jgi:hypothetical protein
MSTDNVPDTKAHYEITVSGTFPDSWRDRVAGMRVQTRCQRDGKPLTTLKGELRDQAELNGVLDTLYNLRLELFRVERNGEPTGP